MIDFFEDYLINDDDLLEELLEKANAEISFEEDITDDEAEELARQLQMSNSNFNNNNKKPLLIDLDKELERLNKTNKITRKNNFTGE